MLVFLPKLPKYQMVPQTYVKLDGKEAQQMLRLVESLEDNDDVQNVYANFDISEEIMNAE